MQPAPQFPTHNALARFIPGGSPHPESRPRLLWLGLEGALYTGCALLIAHALLVPQWGFFAVFLAAAGPTGRLDVLLERNRRAIQQREMPPLRANAATAACVLALFLGSFAAFATAALWMGEARLGAGFGFVLELARLGDETLLTRSFSSALPLFINNAMVLGLFFALAFIYRSYGALLALSWNACVWGLVLAFLARRGMAHSARPALFILVSALAVLPHLILEASAYVLGSLGAIFLSKGLLKYAPGQPLFAGVMRAVLALCALALGCLLLGALIEASVPRLILSLLI